ncbi:hypothetical protein EZS27_003350 [termite gut metagenome]|jgi:outer membrane protein|uniref:Chaperone protein Skp n=1 Tax=termite gut metagenome TaxID=433724 RepID=A0A5J4SSS6_9ZZZZ
MIRKIAFAIMLVLPMGVFAQILKFGHVSSQEIIALMPELTKAQNELQALDKQYTNEIQKINDEFQKKYQDFLDVKDSLPQNISDRRQKELQDILQRSEQYQQDAQQGMSQKQQELMTPIYQKLDNAISAVGAAHGLIYIFDLNRTAIPYVNTHQSIDVTSLVKAELGIK